MRIQQTITLLFLTILCAGKASATDVRLDGQTAATPNAPATTVLLEATDVTNYSPWLSGSLRFEYWFFNTPYTGNPQVGWILGLAPIGQMVAYGYEPYIGQTVPLALPPYGYYCPTFFLTEWDGSSYSPRDYQNYACRFFGDPPNVPPVAIITTVPTTLVGVEPFEFYADWYASYDPDGIIVTSVWVDGDGESFGGPEIEGVLMAGEYELTLYVEDDDGAIGSSTVLIFVPEPTGGLLAGIALLVVLSRNRGRFQ
jgi:hypothetical protein